MCTCVRAYLFPCIREILILRNRLLFPLRRFLARHRSHVFGGQRIPQDAVWNHPTIGEVHIGAELHRDEFVVHLHDNAANPAANALAILFMVAKHFHLVAHLKIVRQAGRLHVIVLRQAEPLRESAFFSRYGVCGNDLVHHADLRRI